MRGLHIRSAAISLLAVWFCASSLYAQVTYSSPLHQYHLSAPNGWVQIPDAFIRQAMWQTTGQYETAFQLQGRQWFAYPYVTVQVMPYTMDHQPDAAEMRHFLATNLNLSEGIIREMPQAEAADWISQGSLPAATPALDTKARTCQMWYSVQLPAVGGVRCVSKGYFGRRALVLVHCNALEYEFGSYRADFDSIRNSFRFEVSAAYQGSGLPGWVRSGIYGAIFGGLAGALVALGLAIAKRRKTQAPLPPSPPPPPPTPQA